MIAFLPKLLKIKSLVVEKEILLFDACFLMKISKFLKLRKLFECDNRIRNFSSDSGLSLITSFIMPERWLWCMYPKSTQ